MNQGLEQTVDNNSSTHIEESNSSSDQKIEAENNQDNSSDVNSQNIDNQKDSNVNNVNAKQGDDINPALKPQLDNANADKAAFEQLRQEAIELNTKQQEALETLINNLNLTASLQDALLLNTVQPSDLEKKKLQNQLKLTNTQLEHYQKLLETTKTESTSLNTTPFSANEEKLTALIDDYNTQTQALNDLIQKEDTLHTSLETRLDTATNADKAAYETLRQKAIELNTKQQVLLNTMLSKFNETINLQNNLQKIKHLSDYEKNELQYQLNDIVTKFQQYQGLLTRAEGELIRLNTIAFSEEKLTIGIENYTKDITNLNAHILEQDKQNTFLATRHTTAAKNIDTRNDILLNFEKPIKALQEKFNKLKDALTKLSTFPEFQAKYSKDELKKLNDLQARLEKGIKEAQSIQASISSLDPGTNQEIFKQNLIDRFKTFNSIIDQANTHQKSLDTRVITIIAAYEVNANMIVDIEKANTLNDANLAAGKISANDHTVLQHSLLEPMTILEKNKDAFLKMANNSYDMNELRKLTVNQTKAQDLITLHGQSIKNASQKAPANPVPTLQAPAGKATEEGIKKLLVALNADSTSNHSYSFEQGVLSYCEKPKTPAVPASPLTPPQPKPIEICRITNFDEGKVTFTKINPQEQPSDETVRGMLVVFEAFSNKDATGKCVSISLVSIDSALEKLMIASLANYLQADPNRKLMPLPNDEVGQRILAALNTVPKIHSQLPGNKQHAIQFNLPGGSLPTGPASPFYNNTLSQSNTNSPANNNPVTASVA